MGRPVNRYMLVIYYPVSKIMSGYPRNNGEQEKLPEEELDDHVRDDRLPKFVFCVDCVHYFLFWVFDYSAFIIGCVTTKFLQLDAYLGWLLCEMVHMLNPLTVT